MQGELRCTINGVVHAIDSFSSEPLLFFLRDKIGLRSTRYGCGQGTCGSCTVIIDGEAKMSCETITKDVSGKTIETAEIFENENEQNIMFCCIKNIKNIRYLFFCYVKKTMNITKLNVLL